MSSEWVVRLSDQAESDLIEIIDWTSRTFGPRQADEYTETVTSAIEKLYSGPEPLGSKIRNDIRPGIRVLHVAHRGRTGRHFLVYRVSKDKGIDILRMLHERMDLMRHIPDTKE